MHGFRAISSLFARTLEMLHKSLRYKCSRFTNDFKRALMAPFTIYIYRPRKVAHSLKIFTSERKRGLTTLSLSKKVMGTYSAYQELTGFCNHRPIHASRNSSLSSIAIRTFAPVTLADLLAHDPIVFVRDVEVRFADVKSLQANPPITMISDPRNTIDRIPRGGNRF